MRRPTFFFCEDFEMPGCIDIRDDANGTWCNPAAYQSRQFCAPGDCQPAGHQGIGPGSSTNGGSVQLNTIPIPDTPLQGAANRVWRVAKSGPGFVDIDSGVNTGVGSGTLFGRLYEATESCAPTGADADGSECPDYTADCEAALGEGCYEWYARVMVYWDPGFVWPDQLDNKLFFTQPYYQLDNPSADFQNGSYVSRGLQCRYEDSGRVIFHDGFMLRHGPPYDAWPVSPPPGAFGYANPPCPDNEDDIPPPGTYLDSSPAAGGGFNSGNIARAPTGQWVSVEFGVKLDDPGTDNGWIKLWVDGVETYNTEREGFQPNVCNVCRPLGSFFITGYMNSLDPWGGFLELDMAVMSRSYIGPPGDQPPPGGGETGTTGTDSTGSGGAASAGDGDSQGGSTGGAATGLGDGAGSETQPEPTSNGTQDGSGPATDAGEASGCACRLDARDRLPLAWWLFAVFGLGLRRARPRERKR